MNVRMKRDRSALSLIAVAVTAMLSSVLISWMAGPDGAVIDLRLAADPTSLSAPGATTTAPDDPASRRDLVARGAYLARVGNCAGCHSAPGRPDYAGGPGIATPFGTVYANNLTPDSQTGLGDWSADDFWQALHRGRGRDGRRLVPAFPYTSYTRVRREDSDAIHAYLRSLPAVRAEPRAHALRFPYDTQAALAAWQWLFFRPDAAAARSASAVMASATPAAASATASATASASASSSSASRAAGSAEYERGEYLALGLGHCDSCHTPRNLLGAPIGRMTGADMPAHDWYAPALQADKASGAIVLPTSEAIVQLLASGRHAQGSASGPMARVVFDSTQHWSTQDLTALAHYLTRDATVLPGRDLPSQAVASDAPPDARTTGVAVEAGADNESPGGRLYAQHCAECHGDRGQGISGAYPALAGNATVLQPGARNLVQVLRWGAFGPATRAHPQPWGMPPQTLTDAETLALINHLRRSWGNDAAPIDDVALVKARR